MAINKQAPQRGISETTKGPKTVKTDGGSERWGKEEKKEEEKQERRRGGRKRRRSVPVEADEDGDLDKRGKASCKRIDILRPVRSLRVRKQANSFSSSLFF